MDDLCRFALAWLVLLALVAVTQAIRDWRGTPAPAPRDDDPVLLNLAAFASLRWWAFPLLYLAALLGAYGFDRADEWLMDLVADHGWTVVHGSAAPDDDPPA